MFTMQTRRAFRVETFQTLELALSAGFSLGVEFDVSAPSGAIVWAWEQRDYYTGNSLSPKRVKLLSIKDGKAYVFAPTNARGIQKYSTPVEIFEHCYFRSEQAMVEAYTTRGA